MYRQKGNLTYETWRDRKPVSVLATIPTSATDSSLVQRSVKESGHWQKKDFTRPGVIDLYNTYMGGVDVMKGVVWYYKVFFLHGRGLCVKCTHSSNQIPKPCQYNQFRV